MFNNAKYFKLNFRHVYYLCIMDADKNSWVGFKM